MPSRPHFAAAPAALNLLLLMVLAVFPVPALANDSDRRAPNASDPRFQFNLPAQSLDNALRAVTAVSGAQLLYSAELVANRQAPALTGRMTCGAALDQLLSNSGLAFLRNGPNTYAITTEARATRRDDPVRLTGDEPAPQSDEAQLQGIGAMAPSANPICQGNIGIVSDERYRPCAPISGAAAH